MAIRCLQSQFIVFQTERKWKIWVSRSFIRKHNSSQNVIKMNRKKPHFSALLPTTCFFCAKPSCWFWLHTHTKNARRINFIKRETRPDKSYESNWCRSKFETCVRSHFCSLLCRTFQWKSVCILSKDNIKLNFNLTYLCTIYLFGTHSLHNINGEWIPNTCHAMLSYHI